MTPEELCIERIRKHVEERYIPSADKVALIHQDIKAYDEDKLEERKEK